MTVAPKIGAVIGTYRLLSVVPVEGVAWPVDSRRRRGDDDRGQPCRTVAGRRPSVAGLVQCLTGGLCVDAVGCNRTRRAGRIGVGHLFVGLRRRTDGRLWRGDHPARPNAKLGDYNGLATHRPWLAAVMALALLSLVGIPPTAGFAGKLLVFAVTIRAGYGWLALIAVLNTVVSLFYYLRKIGPMVLAAPTDRMAVLGGSALIGTALGPPPRSWWG